MKENKLTLDKLLQLGLPCLRNQWLLQEDLGDQAVDVRSTEMVTISWAYIRGGVRELN